VTLTAGRLEMIRIAIPIFHKRVSPIIDSCTRVLIIDFDQDTELSRQEIFVENFSIADRVNLKKKMNINVIICCAVSEVMAHMLQGARIELICGIVGNVDKVLDAYFSNHLDDDSFHMPGYDKTQ
jgi:predicted Fe-Mo cluster-binding NifX family protein